METAEPVSIAEGAQGMEMRKQIRSKDICLICGRPSLRLICLLCARRLRREALHEEIEDEKQGKRPSHIVHE